MRHDVIDTIIHARRSDEALILIDCKARLIRIYHEPELMRNQLSLSLYSRIPLNKASRLP